MYQVLSDDEWHDHDELIAAMRELIPPARAARANERIRRQTLRRSGTDDTQPRRKNLESELRVRWGQRAICNDALQSAWKRGQIDRRGVVGVDREYRLIERG